MPVPVDRVEMEPLADAGGAIHRRGRQRSQQLQTGCGQWFGQTHVGGRPWKTGKQQGLRLGRRQPGQPRAVPVDQLESAAGAAIGVDRDARGTQLVHVAIDGADRHLELLCELLRRDTPAQLQHQHHRQQSTGTHQLAPMSCILISKY